MTSAYEDYTDKELRYLVTRIDNAIDRLQDIRMAKVQFCDREEEKRYYLTCNDTPHGVQNYERLAFMFDWSFHDLSYKSLFQSNANYIKTEYEELFNKYFTEDTLTSDCVGIMLYLDRLVSDVMTHSLSEDTITSVDMLIDDLESVYSYPCLNDSELYEIESEDFDEAWADFGESEFAESIEIAVNTLLKIQGYDSEIDMDLSGDYESTLFNIFCAMNEKFNGGERYIIEGSGVFIHIPVSSKILESLEDFRPMLKGLIEYLTDNEDKALMHAALSQMSLASMTFAE